VVVLMMWSVLTIFGYINALPGAQNLFLKPSNLVGQIATPMSFYAIMAVGMTVVVISGGIDISVGSTMALSALAAAAAVQGFPLDAPAWKVLPVAMVVAPGVGLLCGLFNGALIVGLRLHPFIVTLGTLSIIRGIAIVAPSAATLPTAGKKVPLALTDHFMKFELQHIGPMPDALATIRPVPMVIMLIVVAIGWFYLSMTAGGREIYAVGGNEEAARFSGLRIKRIKLRVYAIAGLTAGIAGMVSLGFFGVASSQTAFGYELTVIAAAVVGGGSLAGGRGTALGALLGALVIATIESGIMTMGWKQEYQRIIIGSAIIVAVAIDRFSEYLRVQRMLGSRRDPAVEKPSRGKTSG
jgi:ribose/xylose/arabinose/galactoside ABC-type transport system permease subunit